MSDEDDIEASRAPLIEHLIELRQRLLWSVVAIGIAFVGCFYFAEDIFNILVRPYEQVAGEEVRMVFTAPQEFFFTQMKLAFFGALFLAFPVIATQLYMFVAPGLYRDERKAFYPYLFATPILFMIGSALVYYVVMPLAMNFFLGTQQTGEDVPVIIELLPRVSEYLGLIMTLIFAFGLVFQLPVVLTLLARVELTTSDGLKTKRKYAVVLAFLAAAILTPPDPISQIGLAVPTILLYEISILAVRVVERRRAKAEAQAEAEA
ncbi:MAG: twin-arginine translocase subunit TatC [Pseudomonadota bacterium]